MGHMSIFIFWLVGVGRGYQLLIIPNNSSNQLLTEHELPSGLRASCTPLE